jgi:hypothetical protein
VSRITLPPETIQYVKGDVAERQPAVERDNGGI